MQHSISTNKTNLFKLAVALSIVASFSTIPPNELKLALYVLSLLITFFVFKGLPRRNYKPLKLLFIFFIVELIWKMIGYGHLGNINSIVLNYTSMFTCGVLASGLFYLSHKQLKGLFILIILLLIESIVATVVLSYLMPSGIVRYAINAEHMGEIGINENIFRTGLVSYPLAHIWCAVLVSCLVFFFESKRKVTKVFFMILAIAIGYVLFHNTITTSLLVGVICCGIVIVYYLSQGNLRVFFILSIFIVILGISSSSFISDVVVNMSDNTDNTQITKKFIAISENMKGDDSDDNQVSRRGNAYAKSWKAFIRNPLFGLAEKHDKPGAINPAGDHSTVPDMLAYYGVFSFFLFASWWTEIKRIRRSLTGKLKFSFLICAFSIILMAFLKGGFHVTYMLFTFLAFKILFMYIETQKNHFEISYS